MDITKEYNALSPKNKKYVDSLTKDMVAAYYKKRGIHDKFGPAAAREVLFKLMQYFAKQE